VASVAELDLVGILTPAVAEDTAVGHDYGVTPVIIFRAGTRRQLFHQEQRPTKGGGLGSYCEAVFGQDGSGRHNSSRLTIAIFVGVVVDVAVAMSGGPIGRRVEEAPVAVSLGDNIPGGGVPPR